MSRNDIENGMVFPKFWEKVYDEETGEEWEREVPACHCSECNKAIYEKDNCYVFPRMLEDVPYILCEDCIDEYAAYGKDGAQALINAANRQRESSMSENARRAV